MTYLVASLRHLESCCSLGNLVPESFWGGPRDSAYVKRHFFALFECNILLIN